MHRSRLLTTVQMHKCLVALYVSHRRGTCGSRASETVPAISNGHLLLYVHPYAPVSAARYYFYLAQDLDACNSRINEYSFVRLYVCLRQPAQFD